MECDFEDGWCGYTQATDDEFDWTRLSGRTGSSSTGPSFDHTTGTYRECCGVLIHDIIVIADRIEV